MIQIDNVKALEEILNRCCDETELPSCKVKGCNRCEAEFLNEHGATVKVHGRWLSCLGNERHLNSKGYTQGECYCSVCGDFLMASDEYTCRGNFCPNCGADMRGSNNGQG